MHIWFSFASYDGASSFYGSWLDLHSTLSLHTMSAMQQEAATMATLTIRNVDAGVKERLRVRAARRGRSMEAEARSILSEAVAGDRDQPEPNLAETIRRRFAPLGGVDLELPPAEFVDAPPSFDP
jgi:plasmid stability protein